MQFIDHLLHTWQRDGCVYIFGTFHPRKSPMRGTLLQSGNEDTEPRECKLLTQSHAANKEPVLMDTKPYPDLFDFISTFLLSILYCFSVVTLDASFSAGHYNTELTRNLKIVFYL